MELVRPTEVTGKILSLIEDAREELIIVSPYNDFARWDKLKRFIVEAKQRGIEISYYARENEDHSCLEVVDIQPILIKNLHAKMYLNEKYAIMSSMNLVEASDKKSIDFALITKTDAQFSEVKKYFRDFILPKAPHTFKEVRTIVDLPCSEYFTTSLDYQNKKLELSLQYHKNSSFIKEFGHLNNGKKYGSWLYFNSDGLLEVVEKHYEHATKDRLNYNGKVSRYYLLFTVANVISGIFGCSIKDFYFKSYLKDYIKDNPEAFFKQLKLNFELQYLDYNSKYAEDLVDEIHDAIIQKNKLANF
jgi:hypothetical protein